MAKLYGKNVADFDAANLMSFGKSFSRLNGQPLDKSEIWYNDLAALEAYAKTDAAYAGQKVVFIQTEEDENQNIIGGSITHYSINIDGSLSKIGNPEELQNVVDILFGVDNSVGLVDRVEVLEAEDFITTNEANRIIADAIAAAPHLKREVVEVLPDVNEADINTIYMVAVASDELEENDAYDEYMVLDVDGNRSLEKLGSWKVDLTNYATKTELNNLTDGVNETIQNLSDEIERSIAADDKLEEDILNVQNSASIAGTNALLALEEIDELQESVAEKVDKTYTLIPAIDKDNGKLLTEKEFNESACYVLVGEQYIQATVYDENTIYYLQRVDEDGSLMYDQVPHTLLSPYDKEKLDSLVLNDDGGVEISGIVNIKNVQGLEGYLTEAHLHPNLLKQVNYITSVEPENFTINSGKLLFTPTTGRLLTPQDETQLNLLQAVDTDVFALTPIATGMDENNSTIYKNTLQLKQVPAEVLKPVLGDLTTLPLVNLKDGSSSNNLVDNIQNIYNILTWGEMD